MVQPPTGRVKKVNSQFKEQATFHSAKPRSVVPKYKVSQKDAGHEQVQLSDAKVFDQRGKMVTAVMAQLSGVVLSTFFVLRVGVAFPCVLAHVQIPKPCTLADGVKPPMYLVSRVGPIGKPMGTVQ